MVEFEFNFLGEKHKARFTKNEYANNSNLYIGVVTEEDGYWEPWCDLTVNLGIPVPRNEAFLDTNNCAPEIITKLLGKGYAVDTGVRRSSGFCTYPLVRFTDEFLNGMFD